MAVAQSLDIHGGPLLVRAGTIRKRDKRHKTSKPQVTKNAIL
jgi:hypothetical protein